MPALTRITGGVALTPIVEDNPGLAQIFAAAANAVIELILQGDPPSAQLAVRDNQVMIDVYLPFDGAREELCFSIPIDALIENAVTLDDTPAEDWRRIAGAFLTAGGIAERHSRPLA